MIITAASVPAGETIDADVCIIGAGPAGLSLARKLDGTRHRVYIIETGGEHPDDFSARMSEGDSVGHHYFDIKTSRERVLGGSSYIWEEWMRARPLDPIDFERRSWVEHSGWPFGREELQPFYKEAQDLLGLGPFDYEVEGAYEGDVRQVRFRYSATADFTTSRSWLEKSSNICVVLGGTALQLVPSDDQPERVESVEVGAVGGHVFSVGSDVVVLAGGGIEVPRLLLLSRKRMASGFGNHHDLVGRYFMEHPRVSRGRVDWTGGKSAETFAIVRHADHATRLAFAATPELMEREGLLNGMILLTPASEREVSESVRSLAMVRDRIFRGKESGERTPGHVRSLVRNLMKTWQETHVDSETKAGLLRVSATVEQEPNPQSRITLGEQLDPLGQPLPELDWQLGAKEKRTIREMQVALSAWLQNQGAGEFSGLLGDEEPDRALRGEWHQLGTARMSTSERSGVVDPDLRVHGSANVYVAGGAVFPTVGYANPTLTIVALSLRLASHLEPRLASRPSLGAFW